jgi:hypothetical protein
MVNSGYRGQGTENRRQRSEIVVIARKPPKAADEAIIR